MPLNFSSIFVPFVLNELKLVKKSECGFAIALAAIWGIVRRPRVKPTVGEARNNIVYIDDTLARCVHSLRQQKHAAQVIKRFAILLQLL
jgi:hypothetical protein